MQNKLQFLKHKHPPEIIMGKKPQKNSCRCISVPLWYHKIQCILFESDKSVLLIFKFQNHQLHAKCQNNRKAQHQGYHLSINKLYLFITKSKIQFGYFMSEIKAKNLLNKHIPTLWETCFRLILEHVSCTLEEREQIRVC